VLCREFHKLPSEIDNETVWNVRFLLEGLKREKKNRPTE
jgi:hypothetical protein